MSEFIEKNILPLIFGLPRVDKGINSQNDHYFKILLQSYKLL